MSGNIFFLGNALFDVSAFCDDSILDKYDLKPDENCEATAKHENLFKELMQNSHSFYSPGGSAQNSARFSQWLFNSWGKGQATFVGCVGCDGIGNKLCNMLKQSSVNVMYDTTENAQTGITAAIVLKNSNKRTLCARLGAAGCFDPKFLSSAAVSEEISKCGIVYVEGYFLSHNEESFVKLAQYAKKNSKFFAINLSGDYICRDHSKTLKNCLSCADLVVGNLSEAVTLAHSFDIDCSTADDCATAIRSFHSNCKLVIITEGSNPVVVCSKQFGIKSYPVPEVANLADTIGCGDAFIGGVLAVLAFEDSLDKAIECGIYCAAAVAAERGCSVPKFNAKFEL